MPHTCGVGPGTGLAGSAWLAPSVADRSCGPLGFAAQIDRVAQDSRQPPAAKEALPYAYLLPDYCSAVATNLQRQGVEVRVLREDVELEAPDTRAGNER